MIHDYTLTTIPKLLIGSSVDVPSHLAFSSDDITPQYADTSISGEAGARISFSASEADGNAVIYTGTRTSVVPPAGGTYLNVSALEDASTGGNMWASALLSSLLHTTSFDLEIRHQITIDR